MRQRAPVEGPSHCLQVSIGETSRLSIGDIHPQEDSQAEDDTYHNGVVHHETMSMQRASAYPHSGGGALVRSQMHGSGHVGAQRGNGVLHEEDETESAEGGGEGPGGSTQSRRLPPLSAPPGPRSAAPDDNTKPLPRRARTSRKQRREQVGVWGTDWPHNYFNNGGGVGGRKREINKGRKSLCLKEKRQKRKR